MQQQDAVARYRDENQKTLQLVLWGMAWIVTLAAARFGPGLLWGSHQQLVSWIAVAANVLVGIAWIIAFSRFLRAIDDLQRKIILDALAATLGAGVVIGFAAFVADAAGLLAEDLNVAVFPVLLGIVFMLAFTVGKIRYR